jgi:hypothetical protein
LKIITNIFRWVIKVLAPPKRDLKVVLLCILGGTMIWVLNALNKNYTAVIKCPVRYEYDQDSIIIVSPPPDKIDLNVSAGGWNLMRRTLFFSRFPATLKVYNPVGNHYLLGTTLAPALSEQLVDLHINNVETDTLYFDIQTKKQKVLIGKVDRERINLKENYRIVGPININPGEFTVTGPDKLIDALPEYFEIMIDRNEIDRPFNREIKLDLFLSDHASFDPEEIRISFNVELFLEKEFYIPIIPVNFPDDSSAYIVEPQMRVKFQVSESMSDSVNAGQFRIMANYRNFKRRELVVPIEVESVPDFVINFSTDTTAVRVHYGKARNPS